jgi:hypothetical protein
VEGVGVPYDDWIGQALKRMGGFLVP